MNKTFEATEIALVPNASAQTHAVRGLSATTYYGRQGPCQAKMLVGPREGRVLTMLKAQGETREDALQALEEKLINLRQFLNAAEDTYQGK